MEESVRILGTKLREQGHRLTAARRAILEILVSGDGHMSADEVVSEARNRNAGVGRMTVYRTLELLAELGLIRPTLHKAGAARYVLLDDGRHHHLVCNRCQSVLELDRCLVEGLEQELGRRYDFEVHGHMLELFGLCDRCRDRENADI